MTDHGLHIDSVESFALDEIVRDASKDQQSSLIKSHWTTMATTWDLTKRNKNLKISPKHSQFLGLS